jgi:hypothetical protein
MPRSIWRTQLGQLRKRLPRGAAGRAVTGILERIVDVGHLEKIGGLIYHACPGYRHPLDGKEINFDPPVEADQVPAPWRELLDRGTR